MGASDQRIEFIARGLMRHRSRLLLCRDARQPYHILPGGHVEFGESAAEGLRREFQEEVGLDVEVGACLLVNEHRFEQGGRSRHEVNLVFHVEPSLAFSDGEPPALASPEEHLVLEWVDVAALIEVDLRPPVLKAWLMSGGDGDRSPSHPEWLSHTEKPD